MIVGGGWKPEQFKENRLPTQAELTEAAGDHPAYVQLLYAWALLNQRGMDALHIASDADLPGGGKLDRDSNGKPTGGITGGIVRCLTACQGRRSNSRWRARKSSSES